MKQHHVKIWPQFFRAVADGTLPVQIRHNDRDYQEGDQLVLAEFEPEIVPTTEQGGAYTGATKTVVINRVFRDVPGLEPGYVLLTIRPLVGR